MMFPRPLTNFWSISSCFILVARCRERGSEGRSEHVVEGIDREVLELLDLAELVRGGDEHLAERPRSTNRRSPPWWNVSTTWVCGGAAPACWRA